jgi:hypothetical protein
VAAGVRQDPVKPEHERPFMRRTVASKFSRRREPPGGRTLQLRDFCAAAWVVKSSLKGSETIAAKPCTAVTKVQPKRVERAVEGVRFANLPKQQSFNSWRVDSLGADNMLKSQTLLPFSPDL